MAARAQLMLLCISVAILLATPFCDAARTDSRVMLSSTSGLKDDPEVLRNDIDDAVPTSATERGSEFDQWAHFRSQDVTQDYNPPEANPDPGSPTPGIGD